MCSIGSFPVAMNLKDKGSNRPPPPVVKPKPKPQVKNLHIPQVPYAPSPSYTLTPGQMSDSVVSPPDEFRDPLPPFPAPPEFAAPLPPTRHVSQNLQSSRRPVNFDLPPMPAEFDDDYHTRSYPSPPRLSPQEEQNLSYYSMESKPKARARHASKDKDGAKYSPKPAPRPRHVSHSSVGKTSSMESSHSSGSVLSSEGDSIPSSPSSLRRHQIRKQRASANKHLHTKFLEKHAATPLTSTLPRPDPKGKSPYSDDWMKKKQYLSFSKQNSVRDVKFNVDGNIILTTKYSVQMYDANGNFSEKLYQGRVTEPWGLHIIQATGHVLVSDNEEGCVKEFNGIGIVVQEYGPVPDPCGVTVSNSGYVFVCSQSEACVYVFDRRGEIVTKLGKGKLISPTYVALHGRSILVSEDSSIVAFNVNNDIEFVYGQRDGSDHPACLCVDTKTGYLISTSYYKDSIVALNKTMQRAIRIKDIKRPLVCAISPFGHLLIGEYVSAKGMLFRMFRI